MHFKFYKTEKHSLKTTEGTQQNAELETITKSSFFLNLDIHGLIQKTILFGLVSLLFIGCKKNTSEANNWVEIGNFGLYSGNGEISNAICADNADNLYSTNFGTTDSMIHLIKWNGGTWKDLGSTGASAKEDVVYCMGNDAKGNVFIGGYSSYLDHYTLPWLGNHFEQKLYDNNLYKSDPKGNIYTVRHNVGAASEIERFDSSKATTFLYPVPLYHITCYSIDDKGNVYVIGYNYPTSATVNHLFKKWDGTNWSDLNCASSELKNAVELLCDSKGIVYGLFSEYSNGNTKNKLSKWNGTSWQTLGTPEDDPNYSPYGNSFFIDGKDNLYADFYSKTSNTSSILKWDGTLWNKLNGSTYEGNARLICVDKKGNIFSCSKTDMYFDPIIGSHFNFHIYKYNY